jgi:elongator complex protein 1
MRNLRNTFHAAIRLSRTDESAHFTATAWDGNDLVCSFGPSATSPAISLKRFPQGSHSQDEAAPIAEWDAVSPHPDLDYDRVVNLHCLQESGLICLVLEGGDIVIVRENPQAGESLIEIVGSVDAGITAAAWSPDEELLVIATKADTLLYMTRDFEGTASVNLTLDDLKASNHVSVGWGKAETQFKGRGAKALRDPTVPEHIDQGRLSDLDDARTSISWRGDGQFVAVNSVLENDLRRRIIRVYTREGVLESVSEPVDGLESALSWKPSGQIIAAIQRREQGIDVVFFERNGLRHGEFGLRLPEVDTSTIGGNIGLLWNNDSSVLAITFMDRVQLWTMGNYHYYLKQEILFSAATTNRVNALWHQEKALDLVAFSGSELHVTTYVQHVARGSLLVPNDQGIVAVIDGARLKVTPLRTANVPPPMAYDEIDLPANAIDVAVSKSGKTIAVLHAKTISFWTCDYSTKPVQRLKHSNTFEIRTQGDPNSAIHRQIELDGETDGYIIATSVDISGSLIYQFNENSKPTSGEKSTQISTLFASVNHDGLLVQNDQGLIHSIRTLSSSEKDIGKLPPACTTVDVWSDGDRNIVLGLSSNGVLHISSTAQNLKIPGCTSFCVTATHLIYTTSQHLLKFVHLNSRELAVPPDEPETDERCRSIERGAKLVTVIPSAYSLVLQMPRGNLETIYPRALVLAGIRQAISSKDYKKGFSICRTQRVDMNILHDYAPEQFMANIELFVQQLRKTEYVDLFLSSLSEEDVSQTLYKDTIKLSGDEVNPDSQTADVSSTSKTSKVNAICNGFLRVLQQKRATHLENIVTCHVSKNPPDLEAGLALISDLRKSNNQTQTDKAVEHICFLADVNRLYDAALGIYDIDVALLVAQQSQKDPREYLPHLQKLHDMPSLEQRFTIDNDLKRYNKALNHLHSMDDFERLKTFTAQHELYAAAIELYRYDSARLGQLMRLHAEFLSERSRYKEAGIAYEYILDYESAFQAYRSANLWRECLSSAAFMQMPDDKLKSVAHDIADSLVEAKEFIAAATVHLDYLQDLDSAMRFLCKGYQFSEAIRKAALHRQPSLVKDVVDPGLIESSASTTELLAEMRTQLSAQIPRLRELRQKKAEDPMAFLDGGDGGGGDGHDIPDNISLAATDASTSGGTFMTRYTNRSTGTLATNATRKTSKNRRREERKRARGKKGTVYEEEYLVNSIARLIERLNSVGEDVERLIEGLMRRTMRERAIAVDAAYKDVLDACKECMAEVFESPAAAATGSAHVNGGGNENGADGSAAAEQESRPWGGQGVFWEALTASQQKREAPVLKGMERLSLLDHDSS